MQGKQLRLLRISERRKSSQQLTDEIRAGLNINILSSTVCRRLIAASLHCRDTAKKPLLRTQNKVKRLKFARQHQDWVNEQWNLVLHCSDESKFEAFGSKGHQFVCQRPEECHSVRCLQPPVYNGGGPVTLGLYLSF